MKLLAVSFAYPPLAYPRSIQVARLLKNLSAETVLFCADEPGARTDPTIEPDAESKLEGCVRIPVKSSAASEMIDRIAYRFARGLWNRRNLAPDAYGTWKMAVIAEAEKYLEDTGFRPDAIVAFAQPFTDHLIGLELKKRYGLPLVAHFSDPWSDNPFAPFDERTRRVNLELERSVVEAADMLIFTSAETVDLFFAKYPDELRRKARVLPQCYDAGLFAGTAPGKAGPIVVKYLGNFYGKRTPRPLIEGLSRLYEQDPASLADVTIEIIGPGDADEVARLAAALPGGLVTTRPSVGYRQSLAEMAEADGLLVIDAPAEVSVFLPSKLVDYIGSGRPVLGITPTGTAASLIRELGGIVAPPDRPDAVAAEFREFVNLLRLRRAETSLWGTRDVRERFTATRIAREFEEMMDEVTK